MDRHRVELTLVELTLMPTRPEPTGEVGTLSATHRECPQGVAALSATRQARASNFPPHLGKSTRIPDAKGLRHCRVQCQPMRLMGRTQGQSNRCDAACLDRARPQMPTQ